MRDEFEQAIGEGFRVVKQARENTETTSTTETAQKNTGLTDGVKMSAKENRQGNNPFRTVFAKLGLDKLSEKLGDLFPLSANFETAISKDNTSLSNITISAHSTNRNTSESYYSATRRAIRENFPKGSKIAIEQVGVDAGINLKFADESISKASTGTEKQIILDIIPYVKDLLPHSRLLAVEKVRHTDNKKTSLFCYRLYNAYNRIETDVSNNIVKRQHAVVFTVVQNLDAADAYLVTDIRSIAPDSGHTANNSRSTRIQSNAPVATIAELYKIVKKIPRKNGGLLYSDSQKREYLFDYSETNDGKKYSLKADEVKQDISTTNTKAKQNADTNSTQNLEIETNEGYNRSVKRLPKWHTDLSKTQIKEVEKWLRQAGNPEHTRITDTVNWYKGRIDGKDLFVIYSTEAPDNPTILYEVKGENAIIERDILLDLLEDEENVKSVDGKPSFAQRVSEGSWMQNVNDSQHNFRDLGRGRNNQNVGVLPGQSQRNGSRAFRSVVENIFGKAEREGNSLNVKYNVKPQDNSSSNTNTKQNAQEGTKNILNFDYNELVSKPDMPLAEIDDSVKYDINKQTRKNIVRTAIKNAAAIGDTNSSGGVSVFVRDIDTDVILSTHGLQHGLDRRLQNNAAVVINAGKIMQNAIRINKLTPKSENVADSYVLLGAAKGKSGNLYIVEFVVNSFDNSVASVDVLYSVNAKKESAVLNAPAITESPLRITDSTISIAQLLDMSRRSFPDVLPESVLRHFDYDRRPGGAIGESALYSLKEDKDFQRKYERLLEINQSLREQFKITKFAKADKKALDAFTKKLLKDNFNDQDTDIKDAIAELFEYMANGEDGQPPIFSIFKLSNGVVKIYPLNKLYSLHLYFIMVYCICKRSRGLMDRAPDSGSGGWGFESLRVRHEKSLFCPLTEETFLCNKNSQNLCFGSFLLSFYKCRLHGIKAVSNFLSCE